MEIESVPRAIHSPDAPFPGSERSTELDGILALEALLQSVQTNKAALGESQIVDVSKEFTSAVLALTGNATRRDNDSQAVDFTGPTFDIRAQRVIAIALIRLFGANHEILDNAPHEFRLNAWRLMDSRCRDIYEQMQITAGEQSYKKLGVLRSIPATVTDELSRLVPAIPSLAEFKARRKDVMRVITRPLVKAFVHPFVSEHVSDKTKFENLIHLLTEYETEAGLEKLQALDRVRSAIAEFLFEIRRWPTFYAVTYFTPLIENISSVVEEDFRQSPAAKPAELQIVPSKKKYPLSIYGQAFSLRLTVLNVGAGHAFNVRVNVLVSGNLTPENHEILVASIASSGSSGELELPCEVTESAEFAMASAEVTWTNFDRTIGRATLDFEIQSQRSDIDWRALARLEPYALEPVKTEDNLLGRTEILDRLVSSCQATTIGSFYIKGQKRVGKTSIVATLGHLIRSKETVFLYLDTGEFKDPDPGVTISQLGNQIVSDIRQADVRFASVPVAEFSGSLVPLVSFLKIIEQVSPSSRFIIVLDEFDELPTDFLIHTSIADSFFQTIRSISNRQTVGIILVGGEKMNILLQNHGMVLNKFQGIEINYLDIEHYWPDFQELVRAPVRQWFEVNDEAVRLLHQTSAGNPYFAKVLSGQLYRDSVKNRDADVTRHEVELAINHVLSTIETSRFQHFWDDGIVAENLDKREQQSAARRELLIAMGQALRKSEAPSINDLLLHAPSMNRFELERGVREFIDRQVFIEVVGGYQCKVPLFGAWLRERGVGEILATISHHEVLGYEPRKEEARVSEHDIHELSERWGLYQGLHVGEERIRAWLNQFDQINDQHLMFKLLQAVKFYSTAIIRDKMREGQRLVQSELAQRRIVQKLEPGKRKRGDILVSYLDRVGKSGPHYARLYAEVNDIYHENIVERPYLKEALEANPEACALVLLDDFIGSGKTILTGVQDLHKDVGDLLRDRKMVVVVVVISGFQKAREFVNAKAVEYGLDLQVRICDSLLESDRCFSETSRIFQDEDEKVRARALAYKWGAILERKHPLGHDESEAAVVFDNNCPNNSLPILWKTGRDWVPLFPRA